MRPSFLVKTERSVVISGFSLLRPSGLSIETILGASEVNWPSASPYVVDADLGPWIGSKGLRFHDRSSQLVLTALSAVKQESQLDQRHARDVVGLVVGSDGALASQNEVVRDAMLTPKLMNPKAYPNRGCNVIAGQASLRFGVRGESSVVSSGYSSGIDALIYATRKLSVSRNPSEAYLVAAGESLSCPREWRKQHGSSTGIGELAEGAFACCLETGLDQIQSGGWRIEGFQQCHTADQSLDDLHNGFVNGFGLNDADIHVCVQANHDQTSCRIGGGRTALSKDYFGASVLMAAFEEVAKLKQLRTSPRISMANLDLAGNASMVLLQRL